MIRIVASWVLYACGALVLHTLGAVLGRWFEFPYRLYARLMTLSYRTQGSGPGPWTTKPADRSREVK